MLSDRPPLSLALSGLPLESATGAALRELIPWVRRVGYTAIQLNAAAPGIRARDLDRSARRDLAAIVRREGLDLSGADLWIPEEHFLDSAQSDRAIAATRGSIELIAELAGLIRGVSTAGNRPVLSVTLPSSLADSMIAEIAAAADRSGVHIADHTLPFRMANPGIKPSMGVGLDPAAALVAGLDPAAQVFALGPRLVSTRLCDVSRNVGGGRVVPGSRDGKLDLLAYSIALSTSGFKGWVVADTRSLQQPDLAARAMLKSWREADTC